MKQNNYGSNYSDLKILVADDDESNLFIASHILKNRLGFPNIIQATDGQEALDLLEKNKDIDMILIDVMMPRKNGMEVCQELSSHPDFKNTPVIFQTGKTSFEDLKEMFSVGAWYLIKKPFKQEDLQLFFYHLSEVLIREKNLKQKVLIEPKNNKTHYEFERFEDVEEVSLKLARHFPKPTEVVSGIYELLANAVEHGNLNMAISKVAYLKAGAYHEKIAEQQENKANKNKKVFAYLIDEGNMISVVIQDEGEGFNFSHYLSVPQESMILPTRKGIARAARSFEFIEYIGNGNKVKASCTLS